MPQLGDKSLNPQVSSRQSIAFVLFGYGLGNSPSLINAAKLLSQSGYSIDFYTCGTFLGDIKFDDPSIEIHIVKGVDCVAPEINLFSRIFYFLGHCLHRILPFPYQIRRNEKLLYRSILAFVGSIAKTVKQKNYLCFVGVEPTGMMVSYYLSLNMKIPYVYYNMELHYGPDLRTAREFAIKNIEKKYNNCADFTITLDEERARLISKENNVSICSIVTIPVCAEGDPYRNKSNILRNRLLLTDDVKIILYAGFLADWAMCEEIALSAQLWPKNWVLVFHSHGYNQKSYLKRMMKYESENIRFSMDPVQYEDLAELLSSADIGIALYRNLGLNFTLINSASGKLAHYLRSGLPVVVNSYPAVSRVVNKYNCGVAIEHPKHLPSAIHQIFNNYEFMQLGAYQCYENNYRFSNYFQKVIDRFNCYGR